METAPRKRGAIYSSMGRPKNADVLSTFPNDIKGHILTIRKKYPGWGARTIYQQLSSDPRYTHIKLPSIRSIATLIKHHGLVKRYNKQVSLPDSNMIKALRAHHVWELDAQGSFKVDNIGPIAMINIKDVYSRIYCMAYPNRKKSIYGFSTRLDYQCALRLAFIENGLPEVIQTDHEGIFFENKGGSPYPTVFHLWLIGLGIKKALSRIAQPTDQARVERMHQTIEKQAIMGVDYQNWNTLFSFCQQRREFLNQTFSCSMIDNKTPYQFAGQAKHSGRFYNLHLEQQMIDLTRIYKFLSKGLWYRWLSKGKSVTLGGQVYYLSKAKADSQLLITFDRESLKLRFHDDKELFIQSMPIKGITKENLMGDIFWKMVNVQLELPLCWDTQKISTTLVHNT